MATKQAREFNMDMLDKDLDDIEELAGFEVPVNGMYTLKFKMELKVVNDKDAAEAKLEVIECLEQNDSEETSTKPGTMFSVLFFVDNGIAMSNLRKFLTPFAEHFSEGNVLKLCVDHLKEEVVISAKVKRKADRKDADKFYADVTDIVVT